MTTPSHVRPLQIRPGARFACAGDGLCCTDIHALGPLTRSEVRSLRCIAEEVVIHLPQVNAHVIQTQADGRCLFLGDSGCALHAGLGAEGKPSGCRRFPFGLTATPTGGRVTTDHRCPCRTMGPRPPIDLVASGRALADAGGRLRADRRISSSVSIDRRRRIGFSRWERLEGELLGRLTAGENPAVVLAAEPFPTLENASWRQVAWEMMDCGEPGTETQGRRSRFEAAFTWFASAVLHLVDGTRVPSIDRPWAAAFDRAEARSPEPERPQAIFADWLSDEIWSLRWISSGPFSVARTDFATRVEVGNAIFRRLRRAGARPDRAAAETITILELVSTSDFWAMISRQMRA